MKLPGTEQKVLGFLPVIVLAIFAVFDNWLWRKGIIRKISRHPDLVGTWKGTLISMRVNDVHEEVEHPPIPIFIVVGQTYTSLSIRLLSEQSGSRSIAAFVQTNEPDDYSVYYHYDNTPGLRFREGSPVHLGGARIDVTGATPSFLEGEYWTNRRSRGTFTARRVSSKKFGTYEQAAAELTEGVG
ncbi:hypothetical protein PO587_27295 [Streptomyces gilvifuscus]|uniref:CD-NTase-associated protein 15 domain-containing protein n=1 Tax=Streptomyces gilvifuscus TaxID=1550617 RepID=A0ABT5G0G2_9ACTN|nr:hypothetical protein [Streptomyces gilvifuscus]MDC2958157.1 hypothetical protein [Streptomyces gilvifuscus]